VPRLYTHGRWVVKSVNEDGFVAAWRELAEWSRGNVEDSSGAVLLRDRAEPSRFLSFGPWESLEAIEAWRADPGFQQRVGRLMEIVEEFEAHTLEVVAEV
jgi:heme-degrading monooxygenase HmoA